MEKEPRRDTLIGIDFGTSKTMVAEYNVLRDHAKIHKLGEEGDAIPSSIYENETGVVLFGEAAVDESLQDNSNHIRRFKMKLGKPGLAHEGRHPGTAVGLVSEFLTHVRKLIETQILHSSVERVALTVPAMFGAAQRRELKTAARLAGFREVELLAEPVAAGLAYCDHQGINGKLRFLVVDWGGGTFDVALIECNESGQFKIRSEFVAGLDNIGGEDMDDDVWELASAMLKKEGHGSLESQSITLWGKYRRDLRRAKERLSTQADVALTFVLNDGKIARVHLDQSRFMAAISEKTRQATDFVSEMLKRCQMVNCSPEFILLAGGTSRIPWLREEFETAAGIKCREWSQGREAIALGAAIHARDSWGDETSENNHRIENIMNAEQGIVGWDWDGSGHDYREFDISFNKPFGSPPIVQISVQMFDGWSERDSTTRYWISTEEVTCETAKIRIGTWNENKIGGCKIAWLALGQ
jgi:molecular chaperone DnaK (HSP70)